MFRLAKKSDALAELRNEVATYLYDAFTDEDSSLSGLDRWTQRRVTDENMAKISLVHEADDPVEYCYQNLIREIDTEAESGIYLVRTNAPTADLRYLANDPGVSGTLHEKMTKIAPTVFPDELAHSHRDMDLVWVTVEARYDRARIDAAVSEKIMSHLMNGDEGVVDMTMAMRSLLYSFHEDLTRRRSSLPRILNDRATRELVSMVSELSDRASDYDQRVREICVRAGTA